MTDDDLRTFNDECIAVHNALRDKHGVDPVEYDEDLALDCHDYAKELADLGELVHSSPEVKGDNVGENLATMEGIYKNFVFSGLGVAMLWYSEVQFYDFDLEEQVSNESTGHFTQVVWANTKKVGFGRAKVTDGKNTVWYVVGRYYPAGNIYGSFIENVPRFYGYSNWDDLPPVQHYLTELRSWEYTNARRHILDEYSFKMSTKTANDNKEYTITETFTTPDGETYSGTEIYMHDPREEDRPVKNPYLTSDYEIELEVTRSNSFGSHNSQPNSDNDISISVSISIAEDIILDIDDDMTKLFIKEVVAQHNFYRNRHGVQNLILDKELCESASNWAESMANEGSMSFSNKQFRNSSVGENITMKFEEITYNSGNKLVDSWYNEGYSYDYDSDLDNFNEVGHFTQLIWKSSKKIGVGVSTSTLGHVFVCCFYYPPGNVEKRFRKNVKKLL